MKRLLTLVAAGTIGCGGATKQVASPVSVKSAALPFHVLDGRNGKDVSPEVFYASLADAQAVCVGESHSNPHHHWAQLQIFDELTRRASAAGRVVALGMEMFQLPYQEVLDDYAAGRIGEPALLGRAQWKKRWGFDFNLYRPLIELAVERGAALVALNAPREITKVVGRGGLDALDAQQRALIPKDIDLSVAEHRAWFDEIMDGHAMGGDGKEGPSSEHIYAAQVVWDETMADTAARWLAGGQGRQIAILAGSGHCHDSAIVGRVARRQPGLAVSVRPIVDDGQGNVSELFESSRHDFIFVMTTPDAAGEPASGPTSMH